MKYKKLPPQEYNKSKAPEDWAVGDEHLIVDDEGKFIARCPITESGMILAALNAYASKGTC